MKMQGLVPEQEGNDDDHTVDQNSRDYLNRRNITKFTREFTFYSLFRVSCESGMDLRDDTGGYTGHWVMGMTGRDLSGILTLHFSWSVMPEWSTVASGRF